MTFLTTSFSVFTLNCIVCFQNITKIILTKRYSSWYEFCWVICINIPIFSSLMWQIHHPSTCLGWEQSKITTVSTLCVWMFISEIKPFAKSDCALSLLSSQIQTNFSNHFSVGKSLCFCNYSTQICVLLKSHRHRIPFLFLVMHGSLSMPTASPITLSTASNVQSSLT